MTPGSEERSVIAEAPQTAAQLLLRSGTGHDRAGRFEEAIAAYEQAIRIAQMGGRKQRRVMIEAVRRLAVVRHRRNEVEEARILCHRSFEEARTLEDPTLAGEALNALGGFDIETGDLEAACDRYQAALELATEAPGLRGRIEQNLGIVASIRGLHDQADSHFRRALEAFEQHRDEAGIAIAYHNLGIIGIRRGEFEEAERCFAASAARASRGGEVYLEGLCELSRAEVAHRREHYSTALRLAENALEVFEQIGVRIAQARAYRIIGMVLRESGRAALAEDRLRTAMGIARESGAVLEEAEAARELAQLHQSTGRTGDAVALLGSARKLFQRLGASLDLQETDRLIAELAA